MSPRIPIRVVVVFVLLLAAPFVARGEQLPIRTYTTADGLASDTVYRVVPDPRGFLWFCTADGLSRFDGYSFESYTTRQGLPDRRVSDVCVTRDGTVWVATAGGLCRFDPHATSTASMFSIQSFGDEPKANDVNVLVEARDGSLWCGTERGLERLEPRDGQWVGSRVDIGADAPVTALAEDRWDGMWAGLNGEVRLVRPGGSVRTLPLTGASRDDAVAASVASVTSLYVDAAARLWVGTWVGVCRSAERESSDAPATLIGPRSGMPTGWCNAFFESVDGTVWIATTKGLWRGGGPDGMTFERRAALDSVCDREMWDVTEDRDGNLWVASSCGVLRVDRYGFTGYTLADGLGSVAVNSIFESNAGDLIVTTSLKSRLVQRFDGAAFTSVVPKNLPTSYPGWGWGQTIIQDREGAWWVPIGIGLYRYPKADRPDAALGAKPEVMYYGHEVFRVFEDVRGDVWLSTVPLNRLLRWNRATGRLVDVTDEAGVVGEFSTFCNGPDGALWIGTGSGGGLVRYLNGRFDRFTEADGLPAGWLRAITLDSAGRMWIASSLGGLLRVDDPTAVRPHFVAYTTVDGLSSDNVWSVVEDAWGRIYAGTTRGVDCLEPSTGSVRHYTSADGLPRSQPFCAYRDRRGGLWFGSTFGLVRFDPEPERRREPPRMLLTGLRVAGVARPISPVGEVIAPSMELGSNQNSISLDFLGLGSSLGEELRYQHRLEGADSEWSPPSSERTVTFANLAPGSYRLLVRAVDADGLVSPEAGAVSFNIAVPIWRRWWVLTLVGLAVCAAAYAMFRYRLSRLLAIERVRTHIATDLHDDIGSNLTRIAILSEVAQYARSDDVGPNGSLASIASISRESVAAMSDIVWAINPKKDSVDDLVRRMRRFAGEVFASRGMELDFRGPEHERVVKLDHQTRRQLFLIFKEAVTNAVRHGGGSRAEIELVVRNGSLVLTIVDDGCGFDESAVGDGNGIESMPTKGDLASRCSGCGVVAGKRDSDNARCPHRFRQPPGSKHPRRRVRVTTSALQAASRSSPNG